MTAKADADRKALLEQAKKDLAREQETDGEKKVRSMIREEIADALSGFFAEDEPKKPGSPGDFFGGLLGRSTGS